MSRRRTSEVTFASDTPAVSKGKREEKGDDKPGKKDGKAESGGGGILNSPLLIHISVELMCLVALVVYIHKKTSSIRNETQESFKQLTEVLQSYKFAIAKHEMILTQVVGGPDMMKRISEDFGRSEAGETGKATPHGREAGNAESRTRIPPSKESEEREASEDEEEVNERSNIPLKQATKIPVQTSKKPKPRKKVQQDEEEFIGQEIVFEVEGDVLNGGRASGRREKNEGRPTKSVKIQEIEDESEDETLARELRAIAEKRELEKNRRRVREDDE